MSRLEPGELLFYRTDPADPMYISHVVVYIGNRKMGCLDEHVQRGAKIGVGIDDVGPRG